MKIVLPGGSGHTGQSLRKRFEADGHEVVVLARTPRQPFERLWDGETLGEWRQEFEGADAVINLAGRSVSCRYTAENLKEILESRVKSTRVIGNAIQECADPPKVWLNSSTATIYRHTFGEPNDDVTGEIGGTEPDVPPYWSYSIKVATEWEKACFEADTPGTRKAALRSAMVMSQTPGSIFTVFVGLARKGLLGTQGSGRQFVSWIHEDDFYQAIRHILREESLDGPINLASPNPVTMAEFTKTLRDELGVGFGLPATPWMLSIGAAIMGTDPELILKSRRVVPRRLLDSGFEFLYSDWRLAARELIMRTDRKVA